MTRIHLHHICLALLLFLFANLCAAQDSGLYIGIGAGRTSADFPRPGIAHLDYEPFTSSTGPGGPNVNVAAELTGLSEDDVAPSYEILLGYRLNQHLALEAAYSEFGSVSTEIHTDEIVTTPLLPDAFTRDRAVSSSRESKGAALTLLGAIPLLDRLSLVGLVGVMYSDSTMEQHSLATSSNGGTSMQETAFNDKGSSVFAGAGFDLLLNSNVNLRFLYRYYAEANEQIYGNKDRNGELVRDGEFDLQEVGINLLYKF